MSHVRTAARGLIAAWVALALAAPPTAAAPHRAAQAAPDLQGQWGARFDITPLERPAEFKALAVSDAEAAAFELTFNDPAAAEADFRKSRPNAPYVGYVELQWLGGGRYRLARIGGRARTSILIDPADGHLPLRSAAKARLKARLLTTRRKFDNPESRPLAERCLDVPGPPMADNDDLLIVQTADHVIIDMETGGVPRIVRLGGSRTDDGEIPGWMGVSVGHYEDDTLIVETTGFDAPANWTDAPLSPHAKVTERFSRLSADELLYRFTVQDPVNYTHPWSGVRVLHALTGRMTTYECHEGNYALANVLAGARHAEALGGTPEHLDGGDPPVTTAAGR